jgi:hypothetical protein
MQRHACGKGTPNFQHDLKMSLALKRIWHGVLEQNFLESIDILFISSVYSISTSIGSSHQMYLSP